MCLLLAGAAAGADRSTAPGARTEFEYDGDFLRNFSGGLEQGNAYNGFLKLGETITFGDWQDPSDANNPRREFAIHASVICPHGGGLSDSHVGDLNGVSSYETLSGLRLFSFWVEDNFFSSRLSLRAGIWALDKGSGFWQSDGAGHFLNAGFGSFPVVSNGLVAAVYPVSAPCIRIEWRPVETQPVTWRTAVFSGDVGTPVDNRHNLDWHLNSSDGVAVFTEVEYKAKSADGSPSGTYKLGGFYDSKWFDDLGGGHAHHGNYGFYAIADQHVRSFISSAPQELAVFAKFAVAPHDRNAVVFDTEAGISYTGLMVKKDGQEDVLALGMAHTLVSDQALDTSGNPYSSHRETVLELTYQAHLPFLERMDGLTVQVQPDLQYIINPGAVNGTPNAWVGGVRFSVKF